MDHGGKAILGDVWNGTLDIESTPLWVSIQTRDVDVPAEWRP
jgi:hypothetical protein